MDLNENDIEMESVRCVAYICSDKLLSECDKLNKVQGRASVVHSLIESYDLLDKMRIVSPEPASDEDLLLFHSHDYVLHVKRLSEREDDEKYDEEDNEFGLMYDCPPFPGVHQYASFVAGASMKAAECLTSRFADVAIHWMGGWHHAKRDAASGFCYYNDVVLAILKLRKTFDRVLYVDLDLHHGDGVENAFCVTQKVMTVSFHKYSPGFFPGTGSVSDIGVGKGRHYTVNVPLRDGMKDNEYINIFKRVMSVVYARFQPKAVVCQCGADGLVNDPMNAFNLTCQSYVQCVKYLMDWRLPLMLLGGGGYNIADTARCWTSITAAVLDETLSTNIPEHEYFTLYGPDYDLVLTPGNRPNTNTEEYINLTLTEVLRSLHNVTVK